jgi:hypothetical protein
VGAGLGRDPGDERVALRSRQLDAWDRIDIVRRQVIRIGRVPFELLLVTTMPPAPPACTLNALPTRVIVPRLQTTMSVGWNVPAGNGVLQ